MTMVIRRSVTDLDNGYYTSDTDTIPEDIPIDNNVFDDTTTDTKPLTTVDEVGDEPDEEFLKISAETRNSKQDTYQWEIVWQNVFVAVIYHLLAIWGLYYWLFHVKWVTFWWALAVGYLGALGTTAGAHRLWAHRTYKAKLPLQVILLVLNCVSFQNPITVWVRDHRVHHKFTETDADPHNSRRGFFFSHIGWLLVRKHNDVKTIGHKVSVQDLKDDPLVSFQERHFYLLIFIFSVVIPVSVPVQFFDEPFLYSFLTAFVLRHTLALNYTWCINSIAHLYGSRPYDKNICSRQNLFASLMALGEGWHNFHHKFPRDYRASEYPGYWFNFTKYFIDFFAWIGWAYDLKTATPEAIMRTKIRHGDGTI